MPDAPLDAPPAARDAVSWRDVLAATKRKIGDDSAARWLCEEASGADDLAAVSNEPAPPRLLARLDAMVRRHLAGEPLAYVLGHWSFRHIEVAVDRRVLIPRPETEVVAGTAIELARTLPRPITVVDLGTGSGAIGLAMADEMPTEGVTIWLTDASEEAIELARSNLAGMGRKAVNVRVATGSWFDALPVRTSVDVAVANPPYIADDDLVDDAVRRWEPHRALFAGADGLDDVRRLVTDAPRWVRPGGWLVLEIGADQGGAVDGLLRARGYDRVEIRPDLAGRDRVAVAQLPTPHRLGGHRLISPSGR